MRVAQYTDGVKRAEVRVSFVLDREEVINNLCSELVGLYGPETAHGVLGRAKAEKMLRDALRWRSQPVFEEEWSDGLLDKEEKAELSGWVSEQVDRLWPELSS